MHDANMIEVMRERERRERTMAALAQMPDVAAMHRELADHYRQMIAEANGRRELRRMPPAR